MKPRGLCLIRSEPHYRADAFRAGLANCGFEVHTDSRLFGKPRLEDCLVTWNRYGAGEDLARQFEAVGAMVLIAENGLIGRSQNAYAKQYVTYSQEPDGQLYTLSLNFHNGAGAWHVGERPRWQEQGIRLWPWRAADDDGRGHVLLLEQRGFGSRVVAPPPDWSQATASRLKKLTHRPIRIRKHPGNSPARVPLEEDLAGCWAAIVHGSGAGIHALCRGIPCYSTWDRWVGFPAALSLERIGYDEMPTDAARETMLHRVSWLQHTVAEIAAGVPLRRLLAVHREERQKVA